MKLYRFSISEDGDVDFREVSEAMVLERIQEVGPPCFDHVPRMEGSKLHNGSGGCWIVLRGEIVRPEAVRTVTEWKLR